MRIKWYDFSKMSFSPLIEVSTGKNIGKFLTFEKLENMMKKESFFGKKCFHLYNSLLHKNGKAQNMPVVASRLLEYFIKNVALNLKSSSYPFEIHVEFKNLG